MAIVEMKKMHLLALKKDGAKILRGLQRLACVQVIESDEEDMRAFLEAPSTRLEEIQKTIVRLDWAIRKIAVFDPEKKVDVKVFDCIQTYFTVPLTDHYPNLIDAAM